MSIMWKQYITFTKLSWSIIRPETIFWKLYLTMFLRCLLKISGTFFFKSISISSFYQKYFLLCFLSSSLSLSYFIILAKLGRFTKNTFATIPSICFPKFKDRISLNSRKCYFKMRTGPNRTYFMHMLTLRRANSIVCVYSCTDIQKNYTFLTLF